MNYSCRGDAKLRETFLRRGEPVPLCVRVSRYARFVQVKVCVCVCVCARVVEGVRRARSRNECGKARDHRAVEGEDESLQEGEEGLKRREDFGKRIYNASN